MKKKNFLNILILGTAIIAIVVTLAVLISSMIAPAAEKEEAPVSDILTNGVTYHFNNVEGAVKALEMLTTQTYVEGTVNDEALYAYYDAVERAVGFMDMADTSSDTYLEEASAVATEVRAALDRIEYNRGDVPRVYINTTTNVVTNFAKDKTVTAIEANSAHSAAMAADGTSETYWESDGNPVQTVILDMTRTREFGYIGVEWGKGAPKVYDIFVSEDGENWTCVKNVTSGFKSKTESVEFETPMTGRYVKLQTHEAAAASKTYILEEITVAVSKPVRATAINMNYKEAGIVIVDKEGGEYPTIEDNITIRIRGNSTANTVKNPYNIKFAEKQTILGIEGTRKWVLIANLFDKTLMRNKLAYDFSAIAGVPVALETAFVEVYLDGEYKGCYVLSQPVSDGIVDIDVTKDEMLLERNGYYNLDAAGVTFNYTPVQGIRFVPIQPEHGFETDRQKSMIKNLLSRVELSAISGDRDRIEKNIDVDSFVAMYVCEELMKDIDIFHGSTYFYYKNEKMYSGPIWDMDLSMGNVSYSAGWGDDKYAKYHNMRVNGSMRGNGERNDSTTGTWAHVDFYGYLMKADWFFELAKAKYKELIPAIENMYQDGGMIDSYIEEAGNAFHRNYELGGYNMRIKYFYCEYDEPFSTFEKNVEFLKEWLEARDTWLRGYFGLESAEE